MKTGEWVVEIPDEVVCARYTLKGADDLGRRHVPPHGLPRA